MFLFSMDLGCACNDRMKERLNMEEYNLYFCEDEPTWNHGFKILIFVADP